MTTLIHFPTIQIDAPYMFNMSSLEALSHRTEESSAGLFAPIITASVVIFGVILAEWIKRHNERRNLVRNATVELSMKVPHVIVGMTNTGQITDTSMYSPWWNERENVMGLLITVANTMYRPQLHRKEIRKQARDLLARIMAAEMDFMISNIRLTVAECIDISSGDLFHAVFRKPNNLEKEIAKYRKSSRAPTVPPIA